MVSRILRRSVVGLGIGCSTTPGAPPPVSPPPESLAAFDAGPADDSAASAAPSSVGAPLPAMPPSAAPSTGATPPVEAKAPPADMLPVPGGTFVMGADEGGEQDEHPAHQVTVKSFLLDRTEVTNQAYLACVEAKVCRMNRKAPPPGQKQMIEELYLPDHPVVGVSWFDAEGYCKWQGKRLPTEAEWERAASGADGRRYAWGNDPPDPSRHGCFANRSRGTQPVGKFPAGAGPYGHLDLAGNVWEWTADLYDPHAYRRSAAGQGIPGSCEDIKQTQDELRRNKQEGFTGTNPIPTECERVLRGGAYNYPGPGLRVTNRVHHPGTWRLTVAGFRCARDP
jgi:formylglycine-generating enzyme required for sulfatase activity